MAIHLDLTLPSGSSSLPEGFGRAALKRLLLGLAPDEACHAADCYQWPGGLLHRRFTLTYRSKPISGLFSAALSLRSPWADVIRHRALRSPEVPQPCQMNDAAAAIWGSRISYYTAGQGFYAGESGWAGAPGETMNAECRIAVGGGAHPPAGGRWRVAPVGGHAGGGHPHSQLPTAGGTRQSSPEASLLSSAIWPEKASLPAEVSAYQRTMCRLESDSRFSTVA